MIYSGLSTGLLIGSIVIGVVWHDFPTMLHLWAVSGLFAIAGECWGIKDVLRGGS